MRMSFHPVTWMAWVLFACALAIVNSSVTVYFVLIGMSSFIAWQFATDHSRRKMFGIVLTITTLFSLLRIALLLLTSHSGDVSFVTLPSFTMPRIFGGYVVGGALEVVVLKQAVIDSLFILCIVSIFASAAVAVRAADWLQVVPRQFFTPTLAALIGFAAIPSMVSSVKRAKEAEQFRTGGVSARRYRKMRRLVTPVIDDALERSVHLGETLEARGFGLTTHGSQINALLLIGLSAVLCALGVAWNTIGEAQKATGVVITLGLVIALWFHARTHRTTRFRPLTMTSHDRVALVLLGLMLCGVIALGVGT